MNEGMQKAPDVVDEVIAKAVADGASDVHLEPAEHSLRVRVRVDGILHDQVACDQTLIASIVARIKVLAGMDVAEHRIPQDGKFFYAVKDRTYDVRVSTFPSLYGETVVLRMLERDHELLRVDQLGCSQHIEQSLRKVLARPWGFLIVTGPTGSGKTTTLYSLLNTLDHTALNCVTLEDPVEYTIAGITQSQINYDIGFTFERGLRALLRQDPDVILVGEMRDTETARVAMQASLTGHQVLSTLHTNDAPTALVRMVDMGIEPFLLSSAVTGVLAQRLVRRLCQACKKPRALSAQERELAKSSGVSLEQAFEAAGCDACSRRGYKGRIGVFELLEMTPEMKGAVHAGASLSEVIVLARQQGYLPLMADACAKVADGLISIEDALALMV